MRRTLTLLAVLLLPSVSEAGRLTKTAQEFDAEFDYAGGAPTRTIGRAAFVGGILYVVLFVIGTIVLFNGEPDTSSAPEKIIK